MAQSEVGKSTLSGSSGSDNNNHEDVVIRTMQDDIALVKGSKQYLSKSKQQQKNINTAGPVVDQVTNRKSEQKESLPDTKSTVPQPLAPIPTSNNVESQKVVMAPPVKRHKNKSNYLLKLLAIILVLSIVGGAGAIGWTFYLADYFNDEDSDVVQTEFAELENVIPRDVGLLVSYRIDNQQDESNIVNAWKNKVNHASSPTNLLSGDPRYLIENYSVDQIHYILLNGEDNPFLLIPVTADTTTFVESLNIGQKKTVNGWYLLHPSSLALYEQEISKGSWSNKNIPTTEYKILNDKISIVFGTSMLDEARDSWSSESFSSGQLEEMFMNGVFLEQGQALSLSGIAKVNAEQSTSDLVTDQRLLETIPSNTKVVRMGASFVNDLDTWNKNANLLDSGILERPAVKSLLNELNTPYAYFMHDSTKSGASDIGIIISIPESLRAQLRVGDESLEASLPALIPLITKQAAQVELKFSDNIYSEVPLRYVNINGPEQALDYTILEDYILVSSSKEGMFTLIDTVLGNSNSLNTGANWQELLELWGTLPQSKDIIIGRINSLAFASLLPVVAEDNELKFGFTNISSNTSERAFKGIIVPSTTDIPTKDVAPLSDDAFEEDSLENTTDNNPIAE